MAGSLYMLYVDTGGLDRCYPPPPHRAAAEAGCKLQLYVEKLAVLIPAV